MSLILSGTDGLSDVDGSAATPAIRGTDANTGIFFGADTVGISTNGTSAVTVSSAQVVTLANALPVASGGTGATSNAAAPFALKGANSDITSLGGLTTALSLAQGGTAATSASAARTSLGLVIGTDVLAPNGSAASLTSFPTFNQNTTGSAATVTGNATGSTFGFNSGYGSVATAYGCRAWATFNGTTSPATLNASGGITSMTKNSTGNYTVNFSFTFPDANYAAYFGIAGGGGGGNASFVGTVVTTTQYGAPTNKTTTVCQIQTNDYTSTPRDFTQAYVAFIR